MGMLPSSLKVARWLNSSTLSTVSSVKNSKTTSRIVSAAQDSIIASAVRVGIDTILPRIEVTHEGLDEFVPLKTSHSRDGTISAHSSRYSQFNGSTASLSPSVSSCSTGWTSHANSSVDSLADVSEPAYQRQEPKRKLSITALWEKYGNRKKKAPVVDLNAQHLIKRLETVAVEKDHQAFSLPLHYPSGSEDSFEQVTYLEIRKPAKVLSRPESPMRPMPISGTPINEDYALIPAPQARHPSKQKSPIVLPNDEKIQAQSFRIAANTLEDDLRQKNVLIDGLGAFWTRRLGIPTLQGLTLAVAESNTLRDGIKMLGSEAFFPRKSKLATQYSEQVQKHTTIQYTPGVDRAIKHVKNKTAKSLQASQPDAGLEEEIKNCLIRLEFLNSFQPESTIKMHPETKKMIIQPKQRAKLRRLRHKYGKKDRGPISAVHKKLLAGETGMRFIIVGPPGTGKTTGIEKTYRYIGGTRSIIEAGGFPTWEHLTAHNSNNPHPLQDLTQPIPGSLGFLQTVAHFARKRSAIILDEAAKLANAQPENASILVNNSTIPGGLGYPIPIDEFDIYITGNKSLNGGSEGSGLRRRWPELEFGPLAKEKRARAMKKPLYDALKKAIANKRIPNKDTYQLIIDKFRLHKEFIVEQDPTKGAPFVINVAKSWPEIVMDAKGDDEAIKIKIQSIVSQFKEKGDY